MYDDYEDFAFILARRLFCFEAILSHTSVKAISDRLDHLLIYNHSAF
jgi:hypothetical protein